MMMLLAFSCLFFCNFLINVDILEYCYYWGPSSSEGPKNTTNMFSKYNIFTGTFDVEMKVYTI
jgi:hypothetical protein